MCRSTCWAVLRSHLLKLATRGVTKASARTREGIVAVEFTLPHLREDRQRPRRRRECWDLTHEDPSRPGQSEDSDAGREVGVRVRDRSDSVSDLEPATCRQLYGGLSRTVNLSGHLHRYFFVRRWLKRHLQDGIHRKIVSNLIVKKPYHESEWSTLAKLLQALPTHQSKNE